MSKNKSFEIKSTHTSDSVIKIKKQGVYNLSIEFNAYMYSLTTLFSKLDFKYFSKSLKSLLSLSGTGVTKTTSTYGSTILLSVRKDEDGIYSLKLKAEKLEKSAEFNQEQMTEILTAINILL